MIKELFATDRSEGRGFGMVAGPHSVGKTTCVTHFPIKESILISVEDGELSIKGSGWKIWKVDSYQDVIEILTNKLPKEFKGKYVVIDSLAEICAMIQKELKGNYTAKQNFAYHSDTNAIVFHIIRLARQLTQFNIFFTCHTKDVKNSIVADEDLAFDGKMPGDLKKQFDLVVHMKDIEIPGQENKVKCFITNPQISLVCKARVSPWMGITLTDYEEPNLYKLTLKLLGKKGA